MNAINIFVTTTLLGIALGLLVIVLIIKLIDKREEKRRDAYFNSQEYFNILKEAEQLNNFCPDSTPYEPTHEEIHNKRKEFIYNQESIKPMKRKIKIRNK